MQLFALTAEWTTQAKTFSSLQPKITNHVASLGFTVCAVCDTLLRPSIRVRKTLPKKSFCQGGEDKEEGALSTDGQTSSNIHSTTTKYLTQDSKIDV